MLTALESRITAGDLPTRDELDELRRVRKLPGARSLLLAKGSGSRIERAPNCARAFQRATSAR